MSADYTEFDAKLLELIHQGVSNSMRLVPRLEEHAKPYCGEPRGSYMEATPVWRIVDRRLQALRKAKKIAFDNKNGWRAL